MAAPPHRGRTSTKPPPPPRGSEPASGGLPFKAPEFVMPHFGDQGIEGRFAGGSDQTGIDLLRRRVVPPDGLVAPLSVDLFGDGTHVHADDELPGAMNPGTYFTNLMSGGLNDVEDSQDLTQTSETRQEQAPVAAKGSQGRTKNFRDEEDILLVSAWLNVGIDSTLGDDQSQGAYWTRIHEYFHTHKTFESDRSQISLLNRWSGIQHDVNVFCGCILRIEARNHSGWSVDDKVASTCALFKAEDKKHKDFTYMHCWKILKDKSKWIERRKQIGTAKTTSNKKQKTVANSSPSLAGGADSQPPESSLERPAGKKEIQKL